MTSTTITELERAIQRYGDDLYRLALLLTPDEGSAALALTGALRGMLNVAPGSIDEQALFAALMAALPPERRRRWRRLPVWTRPPSSQANSGPLLAALARLPRSQRLALGLTMLRGFDLERAAPLLGGDEMRVRGLVRDALLALMPQATPDRAPADLDSDHAPSACQPTRKALALDITQVHNDPALRGHLALCPACREVEQAWQDLSTSVENALRGALRDVLLPDSLAARLRETLTPDPHLAYRRAPSGGRLRLTLLALVVIALITLLVLPRRPAAKPPTAGTAGLPTAPRALVERARAQLYAPPAGSGVWHGRWEIRWNFVGGGYAILNADQWVDTIDKRHRVELVHQSGGGPYEFELAGDRDLWYAASPSYSPSLYPLIYTTESQGVHLQPSDAERDAMLRARLQSGAWDLAASYLRQALAAPELQSWGRQRTADGTLLDLIGFHGVSPLALPPDAPQATASDATILLAIDATSGTLMEVRELLGGAGREQTGRVTWRFVSGEWITDGAAIERTFDLGQAWNGIGQFAEQAAIVDPALPLVAPQEVVPLAHGVQYGDVSWMPARAPAGTTRAVLVWLANPTSFPGSPSVIVYLGEGRRLAMLTQGGRLEPPPEGDSERVTLNGHAFVLQAGAAQSYLVVSTRSEANRDDQLVTRIGALGYTRAELLDVLRTLGPASVEAYRAQARTFMDLQPQNPAAFDTLLNALASTAPLQPNTTRHLVEQVFLRHAAYVDPLPDPYHLPPYRGWPEQLIDESWSRGAVVSGTFEVSRTLHDRDRIYQQSYTTSNQAWYYDAALNTLTRQGYDVPIQFNQIDQDQSVLLDALACGKNGLARLPDGTRIISSSVPLGDPATPTLDSCRNWRYNSLLEEQRANLRTADGPYLLDVADQPITTWIYLGADGRLARVEIRAGQAQDGMLLESREIMRDEQVPEERVPANTFTAPPPDAMTVEDTGSSNSPSSFTFIPPRTVTLTEVLSQAKTPLLYLPDTPEQQLGTIEAGAPEGSKWSPFYSSETPFESALQRGMALRFTYDQSAMPMLLYEGRADQFGTYLRTLQAPWADSTATTSLIAGRAVGSWQVMLTDGSSWILADLDGTLIAAEATTPAQQNAIAGLEWLK